MKNRGTLTAIAILAVCGWVVAGLGVYSLRITDTREAQAGASALLTIGLVAGTVLTVAWCVALVVSWIIRKVARIQAREFAAAGVGLRAPAPMPNVAPHPAAPQAAATVVCAICCSRTAEWVCATHGGVYCGPCGGAHGVATPGCQWVQFAAPPAAAANGPRAVVTSPLAGLR